MTKALPMIRADIEHISPLTDSIMELVLTPEVYFPYEAGQYLQVLLNGDFLCYSIANAPLGSHKYELHIRIDNHNPSNQALFAEIKQKGFIDIRVPLGNCHVNKLNKQKPVIFIAGGTGFAPIKAMIEDLLANSYQKPFELFWGARSQSDLYMDEKVQQWVAHLKNFAYFSSLPDSDGKKTLASRVILQHPHTLGDYQIVIAGPFDMAYATKDALIAAGVRAEALYSDAFYKD